MKRCVYHGGSRKNALRLRMEEQHAALGSVNNDTMLQNSASMPEPTRETSNLPDGLAALSSASSKFKKLPSFSELFSGVNEARPKQTGVAEMRQAPLTGAISRRYDYESPVSEARVWGSL